MKFILFRVDLVIDGADFSPFLRPRSGGLGLLLLLLVIGLSMAGKDEQLGMPTAFKLGLDDIVVALSVLAGVIVAGLVLAAVLAIAGMFSAFVIFCHQGCLKEQASFYLRVYWCQFLPCVFEKEGPWPTRRRTRNVSGGRVSILNKNTRESHSHGFLTK